MSDKQSQATKLGVAMTKNLSSRQMVELVAAPEVEVPKLAVSAVVSDKRARMQIVLVSIFFPSLWNILLLCMIVVLVIFAKPFVAMGLPQSSAWNVLWIVVLYIPLAVALNLVMLSVAGKLLNRF